MCFPKSDGTRHADIVRHGQLTACGVLPGCLEICEFRSSKRQDVCRDSSRTCRLDTPELHDAREDSALVLLTFFECSEKSRQVGPALGVSAATASRCTVGAGNPKSCISYILLTLLEMELPPPSASQREKSDLTRMLGPVSGLCSFGVPVTK